MRLRWFKNLDSKLQVLVLSVSILIFLACYIPLSKYIKPAITSLLCWPLALGETVSFNARQFLKFQDLTEENKELRAMVDSLSAQLLKLEEASLENERLRSLLSLPQRKSFATIAAQVIGRDSSNWTNILMVNKGTSSGAQEGMPVIWGKNLVGKVIEAGPNTAKVSLMVDFNSKIPAKILRTRDEGIVFGALGKGRNVCKIKYIQQVQVGDQVVSSGLGRIYPKGLLIGEVIAVEEEKAGLYKVAEIKPALNLASMEEVMVIVGQ